MVARTRRRLGYGAALGAGGIALAGYAVQRRISSRWRADEAGMETAGLILGDRLIHHHVPVSDGGSIHVVETGAGPPLVLVHGVTLSVITWARQLSGLSAAHRVIAIDQRGHGLSTAGTGGYGFDRLAEDVLEVLGALDVRGGVLAGHSMGGMAVMATATLAPDRLAEHVGALALVATSAHPVHGLPLSLAAIDRVAVQVERTLVSAHRRGRPAIPGTSALTWAMRVAYGADPEASSVELGRTMMQAMSPAVLGAFIRSIASFDVRDRLGSIRLPTRVVVGTRDLLTPPKHAYTMAKMIPDAELTEFPGCGHMVMLERSDELNALLDALSMEVAAPPSHGVEGRSGRSSAPPEHVAEQFDD